MDTYFPGNRLKDAETELVVSLFGYMAAHEKRDRNQIVDNVLSLRESDPPRYAEAVCRVLIVTLVMFMKMNINSALQDMMSRDNISSCEAEERLMNRIYSSVQVALVKAINKRGAGH